MDALRIALLSGEPAWLLSLRGELALVATPLAFPPGSTLSAHVLRDGAALGDFQVKVSRCRRVGELFHVEGRLRNAVRDVRAVLPALIATVEP